MILKVFSALVLFSALAQAGPRHPDCIDTQQYPNGYDSPSCRFHQAEAAQLERQGLREAQAAAAQTQNLCAKAMTKKFGKSAKDFAMEQDGEYWTMPQLMCKCTVVSSIRTASLKCVSPNM